MKKKSQIIVLDKTRKLRQKSFKKILKVSMQVLYLKSFDKKQVAIKFEPVFCFFSPQKVIYTKNWYLLFNMQRIIRQTNNCTKFQIKVKKIVFKL